MSALLFRSLERLLALLIGALSIYLGYNLFLNLAELSESSGQIEWLGSTITLTHVGPGVFFALFGAMVVWLSLRMQMKYARQETPSLGRKEEEPSPSTVAFTYLTATEHVIDDQAIPSARSRLLRDFRAMDQVCSALDEAADDESVVIAENKRTDFIIAVPRIKEALMLTVWNSDWGDYAAFSAWVRAGCSDPPPKNLEAPARFYLGQE